MVCGGFTCSKNALSALNVLYILVAFILIGLGAYARLAAVITSVHLVGGLIACGVFLWIIAIMGLIGAMKHNQVLLFFYMIVLFLLFLMQFAIAVACLAMSKKDQHQLMHQAWGRSSDPTKVDIMRNLQCCGFEEHSEGGTMGHPACNKAELKCCQGSQAACCLGHANSTSTNNNICPCQQCWDAASLKLNSALKLAGAIGLFFSFTEIVGVWLALRFRNQRDPRVDPSAFL